MRIRGLNGLGLVAASKRTLRSGKEFDSYFPKPSHEDPILSHNAENEDTLERFIPQYATKYKGDTERIAVVLKQKTLHDTCKAIWHFTYDHIQYKLDDPHEEQIRRPARTWAERATGVDCDCYSVFISSILQNLGIRHAIRMTAYYKERGFQHVYIVVPKTATSDLSKRSDYYTLDCVMDAFDAEKPFIAQKDKLIGGNGMLNGIPVRGLNGASQFLAKSDLVYSDVYYHPGVGTWALKGIDGGYYLRGDKNLRYVEPLEGLGANFFKKIAKTALKVVTPIAATAANFVVPGSGQVVSSIGKGLQEGGAKGASKAAVSQAQTTVNNEIQRYAPQVADNSAALEAKIRTANNNTVQSLDTAKNTLQKSIQANNKAVVMSLDAVDKSNKDRLDKFAAIVNDNLSKVKDSASSTEEVTAAIHAATERTAAITAGTQAINREQSVLLSDEAKKNATFRKQVLWGGLAFAIIAAGYVIIRSNSNKKNDH